MLKLWMFKKVFFWCFVHICSWLAVGALLGSYMQLIGCRCSVRFIYAADWLLPLCWVHICSWLAVGVLLGSQMQILWSWGMWHMEPAVWMTSPPVPSGLTYWCTTATAVWVSHVFNLPISPLFLVSPHISIPLHLSPVSSDLPIPLQIKF